MEIIGFFVRLVSSFIWIQIYRLGVSYIDNTVSREADFDIRNSFLNPRTPTMVRQSSDSDEFIGGSIYDPTYYSSLFEEGCGNQSEVGYPQFHVKVFCLFKLLRYTISMLLSTVRLRFHWLILSDSKPFKFMQIWQ